MTRFILCIYLCLLGIFSTGTKKVIVVKHPAPVKQKKPKVQKPKVQKTPKKPKHIKVSQASRSSSHKGEMVVIATAYCPCQKCCGHQATGITSIGIKARHGIMAVDPSVIPMRSAAYIPGYGYAIAADTGSAIRGRKIDLFFNSHQEAKKWGRRVVRIIIK